jgi:uncharacterized membrane protein YjgN (DUF898 family)
MAHKNSLGHADGWQRWACSACGREIYFKDTFCSYCGVTFAETSPDNAGALAASSASNGRPPAFRTYTGTFRGEGLELFGTMLLNGILTILTLGIYAAWGRVKVYQFFYDNTEFAEGYFTFNGTGKEIFFGYLKATAIFVGLYVVLVVGLTVTALMQSQAATFVVVGGWYLMILYLVQFAVFSSRRYRFSRTHFRSIRFRLEGSAAEFANEAFKNLLLAIVTLGFYLPVYFHRQFAYIYNHLRFGSVPFRYTGDEKEFYKIALPGFFLTLLTLGVYYFWWYPKMYNYYVQHLQAGEGKFHAEIRPGEYFSLMLVNLLLIVFTLGIGLAWVQVRTAKFFIERLQLRGEFDVDRVLQAAQQAVSAGGEGLAEALDMDMDLGF